MSLIYNPKYISDIISYDNEENSSFLNVLRYDVKNATMICAII